MNAAEGLSSEAEVARRKVPRLNQNVPVAEVLISPMRSVYIGSTLIPTRIPRSSLLNPQGEFGITISTGAVYQRTRLGSSYAQKRPGCEYVTKADLPGGAFHTPNK